MLYESWPSMFIEIICVIVLRIGFLLVHMGCVPASSVNLLIMQHLVNISISTFTFLIIGFPIAAGNDNLILEVSKMLQGTISIDDFVFNWKIITFSQAIISTVICGKAHMAGCVFISFILSGFVQPAIMYFLWRKVNFLNPKGENMIFFSYGHTVVVHIFSGAFSLGCIMLYGKRIMKVVEIDLCSLTFNSHLGTVIGYGFIITAMMIQPTLIAKKSVATIFINNAFALSTGIILSSVLNSIWRQNSNGYNYWQVVWSLQGGLASLVTVSAGLDVLKPYQVLIIAPAGPIMHFIYSKIVICTIFEDYCNIVGIHALCAAIGTYVNCVQFDLSPADGTIVDKFKQRGIFISSVFFTGFILSIVIQVFLKYTNLLWNAKEKSIQSASEVNKKNISPPNRSKQLIEPQVHILLTLKNNQ